VEFFLQKWQLFLMLFHKNSQMLVKNAKFGTNFGESVKITFSQFCKQGLVGEICILFEVLFSFYPVLFSQILKNILAKNLHGISFQ